MKQKAMLVKDDPRIGCKVRCTDEDWTGIIEHVIRGTDGQECFSIRNGAMARGGVDPENVEFIDDTRCISCGGPRNLAVDTVLQDKCYTCYHKEQGDGR